MKAVAYLRCSTQKQAEALSIEVQRDRIDQYCKLKNIEVIDTIVDEGISGGVNASREGFVRLLGRIEENGIEAVVLYSLERLSRDMLTLLALERFLDEYDIELHTVEGQVSVDSPDGFLSFAMRAFLGEMERRQVKYRTKRAMEHKKAAGQVVGSVPYGYRRDGDNLIEVPEEQAVIKLANRHYQKGMSLAEVVRRVHKAGHRTRSGRPFRAQQILRLLDGYIPSRPRKRSKLGDEIKRFVLAVA
jgi:site-specific DNA recombinase